MKIWIKSTVAMQDAGRQTTFVAGHKYDVDAATARHLIEAGWADECASHPARPARQGKKKGKTGAAVAETAEASPSSDDGGKGEPEA